MNLYRILSICTLLFIACSDGNSNNIFNAESENFMSSSWIASSSSNSRNDVSSSSRNAPTSSSSERSGGNPPSSSFSRHSGLDPESSSSMDSISSSSIQNDNSSSSEPSSSTTVADPTKLFDIRIPDQKFLPCADSIVSEYTREVWMDTVAQSDLICSFDYDGESGFVYVQNNPVSCKLYAGVITYEVNKAEFIVNGTPKEISNVKYHGGGNHGIFELQFTYKGKVFRYDYSTMGLGGRPCQNMDCLMILESDGKTIVQNGCVKEERSLPIVCRHAKKDGTFDSFEDTFHVCQSGIFLD